MLSEKYRKRDHAVNADTIYFIKKALISNYNIEYRIQTNIPHTVYSGIFKLTSPNRGGSLNAWVVNVLRCTKLNNQIKTAVFDVDKSWFAHAMARAGSEQWRNVLYYYWLLKVHSKTIWVPARWILIIVLKSRKKWINNHNHWSRKHIKERWDYRV